ncbi:hypothetical protein DM794_05995 [Paenarthrobacter ureafaciens]|nr:hypothetical protein [Paenarthrobacter ureafaciens]
MKGRNGGLNLLAGLIRFIWARHLKDVPLQRDIDEEAPPGVSATAPTDLPRVRHEWLPAGT